MTDSQNTAAGNTVQLHRVLTSTPEKTWRAFTQADAFARWLPPNGYTGHVHAMDVVFCGFYCDCSCWSTECIQYH